MRVVHVIPDLHPSSGGTSRSVVELTNELARHADVASVLLSQQLAGAPSLPSETAVDRHVVQARSRTDMSLGLSLRRSLSRMAASEWPSLIVGHGLWLPVNHWTTRVARRQGIPLVIHPHGMLEPWALAHRAWKKRAALALFQRTDLHTARAFVATSAMEHQNIRAVGLTQPVAIIPNGVRLDATTLARRPPPAPAPGVRTALFLSRIHPKKGLLNLVRAWAQLELPGWRLALAGPDQDHLAAVLALARELGVSGSIDYLGELGGERKTEAYLNADLFVLPTFSENFGNVVVEALAHGVPVITTRGAPWADLPEHGCGWWIDIGVEPLVRALSEATALTNDERCAMGSRGRDYVRRYCWDVVGRHMVEFYHWLLGTGPLPDHVRTD